MLQENGQHLAAIAGRLFEERFFFAFPNHVRVHTGGRHVPRIPLPSRIARIFSTTSNLDSTPTADPDSDRILLDKRKRRADSAEGTSATNCYRRSR